MFRKLIKAALLCALVVVRLASAQEPVSVPILADGAVEVQVGTPPQTFRLLLDTGSASTWLLSGDSADLNSASSKTFNASGSSTYQVDGRRWETSYAAGLLVEGQLAKDTLELAGLPVRNQMFGLAQSTEGFEFNHFGYDGALGLGSRMRPAVGVLDPVQNLFRQRQIEQEMFSVHLLRDSPTVNGTLVLGGIDERLFTGPITYAPAESRWSFYVDHVYLANKTVAEDHLISTWRAAVLDTTSNIIQIPDEARWMFERQSAAKIEYKTYMLKFPTCDDAEREPDLVLQIRGRNFTIPGRDLVIKLWRQEEAALHEECYSAVFSGGKRWYLGQPFLRNFYTIYDYANKRLGFAESANI